MKIIFLDVDGVLNSQNYFISKYHELGRPVRGKEEIDKVAVKYLKEIVDKTGAKIVLTSSWKIIKRQVQDLKDVLKEYNLSIMDITSNYADKRGKEIREWLNNNKDVESFVILDDDFFKDYNGLENNLVNTSFITGLTKEDVKRAINILDRAK